MKPILCLTFILCSQLLLAQTFTEKLLGTPFEGLYFNSIAFSDVNGDGAPDILITGDSCISRAILYTNDGGGHFSEVPDTPFVGVSSGSVAFSDVNGDGAADVLITGGNNSGDRITKLYTNDGDGNFSEMPNTSFEGVSNSSIAFSDVNGDGNSDVLITGGNNSGDRIAKLYLNDGDGNFFEMPDTLFEGVSGSSVAFSDVNGDGAADVLITGGNNSGDRIAKLFTNDGDGNFSEMPNTPFEGVAGGSVAFSDVNGDGVADVLITGGNNSGDRIAKLYTNDGDGNFFEMPDTPFEGVSGGSVAFSDVNGDGNPDVLITGDIGTGVPIAKLYTSDDDGNFSEMPDTPFEGVSNGSVAFSDVNEDGAPDAFVIGATHNAWIYANPIAKLYTNDGAGNFTTSYVEGVSDGSIAFADVNGDDTPDVLITGDKSFWKAPIAILYTNDGNGNFSELPNTPFEGVSFGSVAFSDVNGDGASDVLITGWNNSVGIAKLYLNDGDGNFSEMPDTPFEGVGSSSIAFSDVNGNGNPDVLIAGRDNSGDRIAKIYTNGGDGNFSEMPNTPFEGVSNSSVAFSDVNGDGTSDVLITGQNSSGVPIAKLYTSDDDGNFSEMPNTPFEGVSNSSVAFSDVNGDGSPDVLITGQNNLGDEIAKLYLNDENGDFSEMPDTPFEGLSYSSVAFSDVNGDDDPDVLITGGNSSGDRFAKLYLNDENGDFSEMPDTPFKGVSNSSVAFSDVNGDGAPDVFITGDECWFILTSKLYINDGLVNSISKLETEENPYAVIYPNPISGEKVNIDYVSAKHSKLQISLYDLSGKMIQQFNTDVFIGQNRITFKPLKIPKGIYFIKLDDNTHIKTLKLIIQ